MFRFLQRFAISRQPLIDQNWLRTGNCFGGATRSWRRAPGDAGRCARGKRAGTRRSAARPNSQAKAGKPGQASQDGATPAVLARPAR